MTPDPAALAEPVEVRGAYDDMPDSSPCDDVADIWAEVDAWIAGWPPPRKEAHQ